MDDWSKELCKLIAQLRPIQGARSTMREYRNLDEQNDARTVLGPPAFSSLTYATGARGETHLTVRWRLTELVVGSN
jgi:hypothetical protein